MCLDAFGQDRHTEAFPKRKNRANDRLGLIAFSQFTNEATIELDPIKGKRLQGTQRRITSTKVVECDTDAKRLDLTKRLKRTLTVRKDDRFSQFEFESIRA